MKRVFAISAGIIILFVSFYFFRQFSKKVDENSKETWKNRPVLEWKKKLYKVEFRGTVVGKGNYNFKDRNLYLIKLGNVTVVNKDSVPDNIEFFNYNGSDKLEFVAYSQNVDRWDKYGLSIGDIIEKKNNNDTVIVFNPDKTPKYLFELFDGIVIDWIPRDLPK